MPASKKPTPPAKRVKPAAPVGVRKVSEPAVTGAPEKAASQAPTAVVKEQPAEIANHAASALAAASSHEALKAAAGPLLDESSQEPSAAPEAMQSHPGAAPVSEAIEESAARLAKEVKMNVGFPQDAAKLARSSVDQAQAAFDKANDFAHSNVQIFDAAAGAFKANAAELQLKAMEIAQANSNAVFGLARSMLAARHPSELIDVQRRFARDQFLRLLRQMNELNTMTLKLASDTARPLQRGILKSFDELKKTVAA